MRRVNASAYIRIPLEFGDGADFDLLVLRMKFEDGFIAYLNGVEVARENAPNDSRWDGWSLQHQKAGNVWKRFSKNSATMAPS